MRHKWRAAIFNCLVVCIVKLRFPTSFHLQSTKLPRLFPVYRGTINNKSFTFRIFQKDFRSTTTHLCLLQDEFLGFEEIRTILIQSTFISSVIRQISFSNPVLLWWNKPCFWLPFILLPPLSHRQLLVCGLHYSISTNYYLYVAINIFRLRYIYKISFFITIWFHLFALKWLSLKIVLTSCIKINVFYSLCMQIRKGTTSFHWFSLNFLKSFCLTWRHYFYNSKYQRFGVQAYAKYFCALRLVWWTLKTQVNHL